MAFLTIFIPQGLSEVEYRRALRIGAREISSWRRDHPDLLEAAGFRVLEETDVTAEFIGTKGALVEARDRYSTELTAKMGAQEFAALMKQQRAELQAAREGLLRRSLFLAQRPR